MSALSEAKERSSRLRARVPVDLVEQRVAANGAEAARQRAIALDDASEDRFKHMQYGVQQS